MKEREEKGTLRITRNLISLKSGLFGKQGVLFHNSAFSLGKRKKKNICLQLLCIEPLEEESLEK